MTTLTNKDLLLRDLSARLPYDVEVKYDNSICEVLAIDTYNEEVTIWKSSGNSPKVKLEKVKPFLFPLSSHTEEQRNNICELLLDTQKKFSPYGEINTKGCDNLFISSVKQSNALINYCLTNHLDINGLIEEGLAIDATGLNIY